MRICSVCGKEMYEGFCIEDTEYYCSEECLHQVYSPEEYEELYNEDLGYWTNWEGEYD